MTSIVFAAVLGGTAHADTKLYPGVACEPDETTNGDMQLNYGVIRNTDNTNNLTVHCPIVHDNYTTNSSVGGSVTIRDGHNSDDLECKLRAYHPVGGSTSSSGWQSTVSTSNESDGENQVLSFSTLNMGSTTDYLYYYSMYCDIPDYDAAYSAVVSYTITE